MFNYNYVLFNTYDNKFGIDQKGYNTICVKDLENCPQIRVVSYPLDYTPKWIRYAFGIHNSEKIAKKIKLPLKNLWYPFYFKNNFEEEKPLCFIVLNHRLSLDYIKFLKKTYPTCRIVLLHRDLIKVCKRVAPQLLFNPIFDLEMTFDSGESKQYGMPIFSEYESKANIPVKSEIESDMFFAGRAKDRLPKLLKAYGIFKEAGLKVYYYLTGVPVEDQISLPGIVYAEKNMSYYEMLCHTVNTRCVLEINQEGASGYTSRFLEAVLYDKKLITNNEFIRQSKFYKSGNIQIVDKMEDIDPSFVKNDFKVKYEYNGEFSPFRMIERVEEELINKYGK